MKICCLYDAKAGYFGELEPLIACWNEIQPNQYRNGKWDPNVILKASMAICNFRKQMKENSLLCERYTTLIDLKGQEAQIFFNQGEIKKSRETFEELRDFITTASS
ncbi:MAG: hypothetical protein K1000chlam2_00747 [Chlamydiae bacterium]|nr:hypothetical protein [Chlamydiota bacterium]